jgi:hypothetical protein
MRPCGRNKKLPYFFVGGDARDVHRLRLMSTLAIRHDFKVKVDDLVALRVDDRAMRVNYAVVCQIKHLLR